MRRPLALLALGVLAVLLEGALARLVPITWLPDPSLLVPVAAALVLGPAEGLLISFAIGLSADLLSGSLLGQQASLRLLEFTATRAVGAQLDLRRPLPLAVFVLAISLADFAGMAALTRLFLGELAFSAREIPWLATRASASALFAPLVAALARAIVERLEASDARREMRLETRRPAL